MTFGPLVELLSGADTASTAARVLSQLEVAALGSRRVGDRLVTTLAVTLR